MTTQTTQPLSKSYDPASIEPDVYRVWMDENLFHADPEDPGKPYCIVIPPPNVTGALHLGHALNNTLQDILIRWRRMAADNAVWIPGTDHAGIATQAVVEKRVLKEEGKRRTEFSREEFVAKIQAWKDEYEQRITDQLKAMGCSCDWPRQAFTMDEPRARAVREAFFQLFKAGLIYRGKRLVNWDPATQTALADDEVEMEEIDGFFYYLRYPIVDEEGATSGTGFQPVSPRAEHGLQTRATQYVTVATTRPETMLGDTAVAINPKDPRAAALRGKKVKLPIVNRIIPIIEDDYVVQPDPKSDDPKAKFATGFLKVTPAHDPNDYEIGLRHNLPMVNVLAPDGTISDKHGWSDVGDAEELLGLDRYEAREAVVEWFRRNNLLEDVKPYRHSVGHSYRSHVAIEPYLSDQCYMKVTFHRLLGAALRVLSSSTSDEATNAQSDPSPTGRGVGEGAPEDQAARSHGAPSPLPSPGGRGGNAREQLRFFPSRFAKTYQSWLQNIRDWCISRQLWWGHRIPVWSKAVKEGKFLIDRRDWLPGHSEWTRIGCVEWDEMRPDGNLIVRFVCPPPDSDGRIERELENTGFIQDPDVLDTWFSSGLWPMSTLGWPDEAALRTPNSALNTWNPTHTLSTDRGIITLWVSRMVMFNLFLLNRLPFHEVLIHATILDGEGRRMSKSLGNGVDPTDIIHSHGADAMRFTLAMMATNTQDIRVPVKQDPTTGKNTSDKFDIGRNFCNKLWNAAKFVLSNLEQIPPLPGAERAGVRGESPHTEPSESPSFSPHPDPLPSGEREWSMPDRWIVSRFNRTVEDASAHLRNYRFDHYAKACYDFFWGDFCDWYIEAAKPALRDPNRAGQTANVLASVLDGALRLMHPMIPYITETIWSKLCEVRPERGVPGRLMSCASKRIIRAAWPPVGDFAQAAEHIFPKIQQIVIAIRNLRNEHKVDPKKPVNVSIRASGDASRQIRELKVEIELLATCRLNAVGTDIVQPPGASKLQAADCEIYIEEIVDRVADQQRVSKRREELTRLIAQLKSRLSNEGYIAKAPAHLVQQTRDQLAAAESELRSLSAAPDPSF